MAKPRNYFIPFLVFLVLSIVFFLTIIITAPYLNTSPATEDGKAMMHAEVHSWGENIDNSSELIFDYWISNFGDSEAKDVVVKCNLDNADGIKVFSGSEPYGNVASKSVVFGEMVKEKNSLIDMDGNFSVYCYVESCDDCEILYKRIPQLYQSFE